MIVDCMMHVWRYPEHFNRETFLLNEPPRRRSWDDERIKKHIDCPIESYLAEMEGVVDKAVLVGDRFRETFGVDVPNDYTAEIVKRYPDKFVGVGGVYPTEEGAAEEVERCVKELGLVGIKISPPYQLFHANDQRCFPVYKKAQELGIPILIHAGFARPRLARLSYVNILALDDIAIEFPELKIVLVHLGHYKYEDAIHLMQKHDNIFADISWLTSVAGLDRRAIPWDLPVVDYPYFHWLYPLLYYFTQTFGLTDKLLFASDFPSCSPKKMVELLKNINPMLKELNLPQIPRTSIDSILNRNWRKVFNIG